MTAGSLRLVADVGGTNARFAQASAEGGLHARRAYKLCDFDSFMDALRVYREETGSVPYRDFALGGAGAVQDGRIKLTNAHWILDAAEISLELGNTPGILANDLEAAAMALPFLDDIHFKPIGSARPASPRYGRMLAVNVGTGFGAATVARTAEGWATCPSEAGHMSLSAASGEELRLLPLGRSVENVLSGDGVVALYRALAGISDRDGPDSSTSVFARASGDQAAAETCRLFTNLLGRIVGDLVLASAAWGGVYLLGGVISGWAGVADMAAFRAAMENKGLMQDRMTEVGAALVLNEDAALLGLAHWPIRAAAVEQ